jgi:hypothetical protein
MFSWSQNVCYALIDSKKHFKKYLFFIQPRPGHLFVSELEIYPIIHENFGLREIWKKGWKNANFSRSFSRSFRTYLPHWPPDFDRVTWVVLPIYKSLIIHVVEVLIILGCFVFWGCCYCCWGGMRSLFFLKSCTRNLRITNRQN